MSEFVERLKEYMEDAHMSGTDMAKTLGCSRVTVSNLLNGAHEPSTALLAKMAEYFNCSTDYLLGLTDYPESKSDGKTRHFSEQLRSCLKMSGKTEYRLQKDLSISRSLTYRWLSGKAIPTVDSLIALAKYFGCTVDYLLGREN